MIITSKSNEKIKYISSLKNKKYRDKYNKYILEGIKLVDEHISSEGNITPEFIVISNDYLLKNVGGKELYEKIKLLDNLIEVDASIFDTLTETETPQGVMIILEKKENSITKLILGINNEEKIIVLDKVSDAGNLGTIIRSAVSFGFKHIICTKGTVDVYSSKVIRSTMGAIEKINICYLDYEEIRMLKKNFKNKGYKLIATDLKAEKYLNETKVTNKFVYALGNESQGLSDTMKNMCDDYIKIPMENIQESLNVAVATSILMYDMYSKNI